MPRRCAVWIDHSRAFIVTFGPEGEAKVEEVESGVASAHKTTGGARSGTPYLHGCATRRSDDEKRQQQLARFYHGILEKVRDRTRILILGPGLARQELAKVLEDLPEHSRPRVEVKPAPRMTQRQLVALARKELEIPAAP